MRRTFRTYERSLILTFENRAQMELLVEHLQDQLRFVDILIAGIPKRLRLTIRGEKEAVKQACRTLKWLQKSIHGITNTDNLGRFRWDSNYFKRIIGGISPDLVLEALQLKGYDVEIYNDFFLSTASMDTVLDMAYTLQHIWTDLSRKIRSQALKRVVTLVSVIRNEDPSQIYVEGTERGLISERENRLTSNPEYVLKTLLGTAPSSK